MQNNRQATGTTPKHAIKLSRSAMSQVAKPYRASLSKTQGRQSYAIIYRHPLRMDRNTGKPGLRVRSGLGTRDENEAERLLAQMNALLGDDDYWSASALATARTRFDARVVDSFFRHLEAQPIDSAAMREALIPLPSFTDSDYRSVLLIGATGVGKTALLRQLIGIDAPRERFPASARCPATIADIEVVVAAGDYHLAVTFVARDMLRDALESCLCAALLAACRSEDKATVRRKLLCSADQRWRFDCILGNACTTQDDAAAAMNQLSGDHVWDNPPTPWSAPSALDPVRTSRLLGAVVKRITVIAAAKSTQLLQTPELSSAGQMAQEQLPFTPQFEEALYRLLAADREYHAIADALLQEIELRFSGLDENGGLRRDSQGYPVSWRFSSADRASFIREAQRFSSIHTHWFGWLLTPLVNGMRIKGPFFPTSSADRKPLVIMDGAGLKATPGTATAVPCDRLRRIDNADAVVVVDSATQPMQDATRNVLQALAQSGNTHKLLLCFTKLDQLSGDDLPRYRDKRAHIRAVIERAVTAIGNDLGYFAWRTLRRQCAACFFFAGLDKQPTLRNKQGKRNRKALRLLLSAIDRQRAGSPLGETATAPVYDRVQFNGAITTAALRFQQQWRCRVGLHEAQLQTAEHWTRIKTLSRYLANQWDEQYDTLMPAADLQHQLMREIYLLIQQPLRWRGGVPAVGDQHLIYDRLLAGLSRQLLSFASRVICRDHVDAWQRAYQQASDNSAAQCAHTIDQAIITSAAATTDHPTLNQNPPLNHALLALFRQTCERFGSGIE